jgi:hypothetical protein
MLYRKVTPQALRFEERRRREDDAPRLHDQVPSLVSLRIEVEDRDGVIAENKYTRCIVVDRAPALFLVPCGDPRCVGGEHDLTADMMTALRSRSTSVHGEDPCRGSLPLGGCTRVLRFEAIATYRP